MCPHLFKIPCFLLVIQCLSVIVQCAKKNRFFTQVSRESDDKEVTIRKSGSAKETWVNDDKLELCAQKKCRLVSVL